MTVSVSFLFLKERRGYYVRKRGPHVNKSGEMSIDSKEAIPDDVFTGSAQPADPRKQTKRGDQIAAAYAERKQDELNGQPVTRPATEMLLPDIWALYRRKNPDDLKEETLRTSAKWARALYRCRCPEHDDLICVAHRPPSTITLAVLDDLRNARMKECRSCGIRADEHPAQTTWKDRKTPTHAFRAISPRQCYNELTLLSSQITYALERGDVTGVFVKAFTRLPKFSGKTGVPKGIYPKVTLQPEEFFRVLAACERLEMSEAEQQRYQAMYAVAVGTGWREHVLAHLDRRWYDRAAQMVHVPAEEMKGRGDDYRALDVPVSRWVAHFIEREMSPERALVFPSPARPGQAQQNFDIVERRLTDLAGLRHKLTWHRLRKTFNTWLQEHRCERHTAEVSFFVREKLMGHALPKQVEAYTDFSVPVLVEALAVIDCIFDQHLAETAGVLPFRKKA